jgi:coenzyme F420-reducing hydrogenase delta subunit
MPRILLISCKFAWAHQGDKGKIAATLPVWEQVVCCGSIELERLLEPFRNGTEGVLILACPHGECHFQEGEWQCLKRVELLKGMLAANGIEPQRLSIHFGNDPEGDSMAVIVGEFAERLQSL